LKTVLAELQAVGTALWWHHALQADKLLLEAHDIFQKTGYRNRYLIFSANGVLTLSVPVAGGRQVKCPYAMVEIDNNQPWQRNHWRTLVSCYNKSPFFFYYADSLQPLFEQPFALLYQWNMAVHQWLCAKLKAVAAAELTTGYNKIAPPAVVDRRDLEKPGSRMHSGLQFATYQQVFPGSFQPNLSCFDVLFNLGNQSSNYLRSLPA
jgi:hypothetical protein